ncbi:MAG TPA: glycoside hydrolase domain-containing protein [Planctomycetota bacterium]|nr:glycoside hydrolase domain-containing protein [Planctomycetota bacterium]
MCPHAAALIGLVLLGGSLFGAAPAPNPSFELGDDQPLGWRLEGHGAWDKAGHTGQRSVSVTGTGTDDGSWRTTDFAFEPNMLYRLAFWAKAERAAGGCVVSGPSFCNRDFSAQPGWQRHAFCFLSPGEVEDAFLRFGQWHLNTTVAFDDVELKTTQAVHEKLGDLALGEGEEILGNRYTFTAPLGGEGANHSRPLFTFQCGFNSNRWTFSGGSEVIYRHELPPHQQTAATIEVNCNYHTGGAGVVEVGPDARAWTPVARFDKVGRVRAHVPKGLLPAPMLCVRLRGEPGAGFQVNEYVYSATLDADLGELRGDTAYLDIQAADPAFPVTVLSLPGAAPDSGWTVSIRNLAGAPARFGIQTSVTDETGRERVSKGRTSASASISIAIGGIGPAVPPPVVDATMQFKVGEPLRHAGTNTVGITVTADGRVVYKASALRKLPVLDDASYGYALPSDPNCPLWWCEGPYKVSRSRPVPTAKKAAIEVAAARHDHEPFQLVLRPKAELKNLRVQVAPLTSGAATLAPEHVRIERVEYLRVTRPTDAAGVRGLWPDPLPPFEQGATLAAEQNCPLWFTVYVPPEQPAGDYAGAIELSADGWNASVPLKLRVYDFALPKSTRLQTGFGLNHALIRRYHNLETADELRKVLDLYLANFAAHRIAPYHPAPLDPFKVEFSTGPWDGGSLDDKDPKEGKLCLRVDDTDARSCVAAHNANAIPVDVKKGYQFSWWAKTAKPGQKYLVTLEQRDAADRWISGNNMDFLREGNGQWQQERPGTIGEGGKAFNPQTKSVRIALRPAPWTDEGEATGTAWFDDVRFETAEGQNLVADGGFEQGAGELKATIDFAAFDREAGKWLGEGGFNAILVRLQGMGGGTFHARHPGRIGGFVQGTPEYEKLMASQGRQLVEHLKAKGWLEKAYMYWFDEPDPKDYAFVAEGMQLIKRVAPGLTRMLTEQPEPALFGHVDLWCPVVSHIKPEAIAERRKAGERFWWYLCCGPRAPYIGLFIDHPAVDLRVWAWLSRKWGVEGQLVWTSNYWTSSAAFPPPEMQNPWQDPMSYCSGYDFTPGRIGYWGNGDGRFLYPPNRDPKADKAKHLGGPVNSIRWEMLREGIEDYELFGLLDGLIAAARKSGRAADLLPEAEKLAQVPDEVIKDDKTYSKDPQPLLTHRRKVAEMVERLAKAQK